MYSCTYVYTPLLGFPLSGIPVLGITPIGISLIGIPRIPHGTCWSHCSASSSHPDEETTALHARLMSPKPGNHSQGDHNNGIPNKGDHNKGDPK